MSRVRLYADEDFSEQAVVTDITIMMLMSNIKIHIVLRLCNVPVEIAVGLVRACPAIIAPEGVILSIVF